MAYSINPHRPRARAIAMQHFSFGRKYPSRSLLLAVMFRTKHTREIVVGAEDIAITRKKAIIVGMVERGGMIQTKHLSGVDAYTVFPYTREVIRPVATVYIDTSSIYKRLHKLSPCDQVCHLIKEHARGNVHTNTTEGF